MGHSSVCVHKHLCPHVDSQGEVQGARKSDSLLLRLEFEGRSKIDLI